MQNYIQKPQPLLGICNLFSPRRSLRSARSYVLRSGRFVFDRPLAGGDMMEIPKLAVIGNCSSRATLLSAWCLVFITVPTLLLTACGNRESKASAISSEPTPVDVVRVR